MRVLLRIVCALLATLLGLYLGSAYEACNETSNLLTNR